MDVRFLSDTLHQNAEVIRALVEGVPAEQARWRHKPSTWSILEVVNHLADEETEDFRRRLELTLNEPETPWPSIDPERWAIERRYNERDLNKSLRRFMVERAESVRWVLGLENPNWNYTHEHPALGLMTAGDVMASWLAHDLLHVRQIADLRYRYLSVSMPGYATDYAG